jgi:hypothetical protein
MEIPERINYRENGAEQNPQLGLPKPLNHLFWRRKNVGGPGHARAAAMPRPSTKLQGFSTAESRKVERASTSAVTLVARKKQPLLKSGGLPSGEGGASVDHQILRLFPDFSRPSGLRSAKPLDLSVQHKPWN